MPRKKKHKNIPPEKDKTDKRFVAPWDGNFHNVAHSPLSKRRVGMTEARKDIALISKAAEGKWDIDDELRSDCVEFLREVIADAREEKASEGMKKLGLVAVNAAAKMVHQNQHSGGEGAGEGNTFNNVNILNLGTAEAEEAYEQLLALQGKLLGGSEDDS